jgi:S-formylglutathione hydrolase FrmB
MKIRRSLFYPALVAACLSILPLGQAGEASLKRITFDAPSVDREMASNVLLPAGYEDSDQRYPVLYLLHGRGGNENYWVDLDVVEKAAPYDMILVMVSAKPSWYVNWAESGEGQKNDWEDYVTKDLIGYVDAHYHTEASREWRVICGKSMGGYGALMLAFKHPNLFASTCSLAGGLRFMDKLREYLREGGRDPMFLTSEVHESKKELAANTPRERIVADLADIDEIDPYQLVLQVPRDQLPDIRIDCGLED